MRMLIKVCLPNGREIDHFAKISQLVYKSKNTQDCGIEIIDSYDDESPRKTYIATKSAINSLLNNNKFITIEVDGDEIIVNTSTITSVEFLDK